MHDDRYACRLSVNPPLSMPEIARLLVAWHAAHGRTLPWRMAAAGQRDPYAVWISEIMLQQTRVEFVIDYYQRWMTTFPTLAALAAADQQTVLKAWDGLGYYARARNLHQAAQHADDRARVRLVAHMAAIRGETTLGQLSEQRERRRRDSRN